MDAGRGRAVGIAVQLRRSGSAGWQAPSAAGDARIVNEALAALSGEFSVLDARTGRPSIPPEKLAGDAVAGVLFDPFERQLMELLEFVLLLRWFVGLGFVDAAA